MSQQTHRGAQVLHGLQLQIVLTLKMKNINLQLRRWSRPTKQNRDQHNPCRTQSISWLKVTRLYQSSNIALELFRICRKGSSPFFIISTTRPEQTRGYSLVWSIHWLTCDKPVSAQLPLWTSAIKFGIVTCGSHVVSCFKSLLCPNNGLISSIFVTYWKAETDYIIDMRSILQNRPT